MITLTELSVESVTKFGGRLGDYMDTHRAIMDLCTPVSSLSGRSLVHTKEFMSFGLNRIMDTASITNSNGKVVSLQAIGELHLLCLYCFVPKKSDWRRVRGNKKWMRGVGNCLMDYSCTTQEILSLQKKR
jgi:hypothetical protein